MVIKRTLQVACACVHRSPRSRIFCFATAVRSHSDARAALRILTTSGPLYRYVSSFPLFSIHVSVARARSHLLLARRQLGPPRNVPLAVFGAPTRDSAADSTPFLVGASTFRAPYTCFAARARRHRTKPCYRQMWASCGDGALPRRRGRVGQHVSAFCRPILFSTLAARCVVPCPSVRQQRLPGVDSPKGHLVLYRAPF